MRYSLSLKAGQPVKQSFRGRCVALPVIGVASQVAVTLFSGNDQVPTELGSLNAGASVYSPDVTFTGAQFVASVDTTLDVIVADFKVEILDGTNTAVAQSQKLLDAVTALGAGPAYSNKAVAKQYQAHGITTAGVGSVSVDVEGTNNGGVTWEQIGTLTLALGVAPVSDSFFSQDRYALVRGNVTGITGTGAAVTLTVGY